MPLLRVQHNDRVWHDTVVTSAGHLHLGLAAAGGGGEGELLGEECIELLLRQLEHQRGPQPVGQHRAARHLGHGDI